MCQQKPSEVLYSMNTTSQSLRQTMHRWSLLEHMKSWQIHYSGGAQQHYCCSWQVLTQPTLTSGPTAMLAKAADA